MRYSIKPKDNKFQITDNQSNKVVGTSISKQKAMRSIHHRENAIDRKSFLEKGLQVRERPTLITVKGHKIGKH